MKVGVIGLGAMGSRMAKNFIEAGHDVHVYNRTKEKADELLGLGASWHESPKELASASEVIITVLTNDEASKSVWLNPNHGAIHSLAKDKVAIECSTISHSWALELARELKGFSYLEAPLVGSRPQVEAKQLTVLVSGDSASYEKIHPLLLDTSAKAPLIGEHGKAIALKLVINSLLGIQTAAFAELYTALLNSGFEKEQVMGILPNLPVTAPIMQIMLGLFAEEKFDPLFPIHLVEKDFAYAKDFISEAGVNTDVVANTQDIFRRAIKAGLGEQNISGILNLYKKGE